MEEYLKKTWFWSDLHIGHNKIYTLPFPSVKDNRERMRPFSTAEEAEEAMVEGYNSVIGQDDTVYFLGDVSFSKKGLDLLNKMTKGNKHLVLGNHDKFSMNLYSKYFDKIYGVLYLPLVKSIATHIPVDPYFLMNGKFKTCIQGHTHDGTVGDDRYINVSVEQTNYRPISLWELRDRLRITLDD